MADNEATVDAKTEGAAPQGIRHVALVGLMGSGKTTVGRRLAPLLGWPLRDSDVEIEAAEGRTVRELAEALGEDAMHGFEERQLLAALADPHRSVISPAASVADSEACLAALAEPDVFVVFLAASPAVAAQRFRTGRHRPWFGPDPEVFLAEQATTRYPRLRALHPLEIATDDRTPEEIVALIAGRLRAPGVGAG